MGAHTSEQRVRIGVQQPLELPFNFIVEVQQRRISGISLTMFLTSEPNGRILLLISAPCLVGTGTPTPIPNAAFKLSAR